MKKVIPNVLSEEEAKYLIKNPKDETILKKIKNTIDDEMTLQRFTNRCLYLYLQDDKFKNKIDNIDELTISGSKF